MTFTETRRHERPLPSRQAKFRCAPSKSLAPIPMSGFWVWQRVRRGQTNPSPQEIITVRYFPDFSRAVVLERERTCKEVENCHRPTLTGNFLSRIPPWKLWKSTVSSTWSQPTTHTWFAHNRKSVGQSSTIQTRTERNNLDLPQISVKLRGKWSLLNQWTSTPHTPSRLSRPQNTPNIPPCRCLTTIFQWPTLHPP